MDMKSVRNRGLIVSVGWENHVLQCEFADGHREQFGGVPRKIYDRLMKTDVPAYTFSWFVRGKFVSQEVDPPAAKTPLSSFDLDRLPF